MGYQVLTTKSFERSLKRCVRRGLDRKLLNEAILKLSKDGFLPPEYKPHKLKGNYKGKWECHIQPDWLLIWDQNDTQLTLLLIDTGTHSDLF